MERLESVWAEGLSETMALYRHESIIQSRFHGNPTVYKRLHTLEAVCMGSYVTKFYSLQVTQPF